MIVSTHQIYDKGEISQETLDSLIIENPAYHSKSRLGFSNKGTDPVIYLYKEKDGKIYVPRNAIRPPAGVKVIDQRVEGREIRITDSITLREDQIPAVEALAKANSGILNAGCGKGKTVMALQAIAQVGRPALILVHKEFLMTQWMERIREFLGVEPGYVQGGVFDWEGRTIVVGMLQTLYARRESLPAGFIENFGIVVSDEVHRVSAPTWSTVVELFPARRRWGLSATLNRSDGLEIVFLSHIGPVLYQLLGTNLQPKVFGVKTGLQMNMAEFYLRSGTLNTAKLLTHLTKVESRNRVILHHLLKAARAGRRILLLSDRVEHLKFLKYSFDEATKGSGIETRLYIGGMEQGARAEAEENADILFASSQMAKEALDIPSLDTLFLATPQGSPITTEQAVGRIARSFEGKKEPLVVDFVDSDIKYCSALWGKRIKIYKKLGLEFAGQKEKEKQ